MAKKKWAGPVVKKMKKGAFGAWCKSHGFGDTVNAACIAAGLKSKDKKVVKMAGLAKAFATIRPKGKAAKTAAKKGARTKAKGPRKKVIRKSPTCRTKRFEGGIGNW